MIKASILGALADALRNAAPELNTLAVDDTILDSLRLERPRNPEHGDYAVNVSFLARSTKMAPPAIAAILAKHLSESCPERFVITPLGGYLNFAIKDAVLLEAVAGILQTDTPGKNDSLSDERILLEYVSANPTGPLHIGHGRWAALGDSLVRMLRHCGADVTAEFYINDFGFQMEKLALSLWWRSVEQLKNDGALSGLDPAADLLAGMELPYAGEFVIDVAQALLADASYKEATLQEWKAAFPAYAGQPITTENDINAQPVWSETIKNRLLAVAVPYLLGGQKQLLETMRVHFDVWTSEKEAMHQSGAVAKALEALEKTNHIYEEDGALWFRSEDFGDEKNRVLRKQDGSFTYLTADIAYHDDKFKRSTSKGQPYTRVLNIWGADHHGYIARLRGAIAALGHNPDQFEVLLGQLVNLVIDGERTRMGKRRKMLTLQDVVDEVGVDATRFWMVSKSADSTLDFDVDLASSSTNDNPVFYVQYAHARCCSIIRNATESAPDVDTGEMTAPAVDPVAFEKHSRQSGYTFLEPLLASVASSDDEKACTALKALILKLDGFEDMVRDASRLRSPHFLTQYMMDLAAQFHSFYNVCRILTPDATVTESRLMLILALRRVLAQALDLLGVTAPERM